MSNDLTVSVTDCLLLSHGFTIFLFAIHSQSHWIIVKMDMELIVVLEFFTNLYKLTNNMKGSGEKKKKKKSNSEKGIFASCSKS